MKALDRLRIKDNHKIKEIEDHLENEITNILNKKRFAPNNYNNYSDQPSYYDDQLSNKVKSLFRNRNHKEQYLPFNKEEIRPVIRENYNSPEVGDLILETLQPIIEGWLDDNLERVVHKVVKKNLSRNDDNFHKVVNNAYDYYEQESDDYHDSEQQYTQRNNRYQEDLYRGEPQRHHLEQHNTNNKRTKPNSAAYYQQLHDNNSRYGYENNSRGMRPAKPRRPKR